MKIECICENGKKVLVPLWLFAAMILFGGIIFITTFFAFLIPLNEYQGNSLINVLYPSMLGLALGMMPLAASSSGTSCIWPVMLRE